MSFSSSLRSQDGTQPQDLIAVSLESEDLDFVIPDMPIALDLDLNSIDIDCSLLSLICIKQALERDTSSVVAIHRLAPLVRKRKIVGWVRCQGGGCPRLIR